jgi:hypothetical protein
MSIHERVTGPDSQSRAIAGSAGVVFGSGCVVGHQLHPWADLHLKSLPADIKAVVYGTNHEFYIVSLDYQNSAELSKLTYEWRLAIWLESDTTCQHTHHTSIINSSPDLP